MLTIRPEGTPEKLILGQIYAEALKAAGYKVKIEGPVDEEGGFGITHVGQTKALRSGQISGYPEHLSSTLYYDFGVEMDQLPTEAHEAYEEAKKDFEEEKGLTAFPPTPFGIANAVGMLRKTAEERGLKTDSDLKGKAEEMTIKAPTY